MTEESKKRLTEIDKELQVATNKWRELHAKRNEIVVEKYNDVIKPNKIYKFDHYGNTYIGRITNIWWSSSEEKIIVVVCALIKSFTEFQDEAFCEFDAMFQLRYTEESMDETMESIEEISDEELRNYINEWISESETNIKKWFNVEE